MHLTIQPGRTIFETELQVRPDDVDMNRHVHGSRYMDYVLAARYDQMARCYGMSIEEFHALGFSWFIQSVFLEYKRPLSFGEWMVVRTWVDEFIKNGVAVKFEILRKSNRKLASDGFFNFVMVNTQTGRAEAIPEWIARKYAV